MQFSSTNAYNPGIYALNFMWLGLSNYKSDYLYRLWENSKYVSKQLDKIGLMLSTTLVNAGLTSFNKIQASQARELEMVGIDC